jgi:hypothetical protein
MMCLTHGEKTERMTPMNVDRGFEAVFRIRISFLRIRMQAKMSMWIRIQIVENVKGLLEI